DIAETWGNGQIHLTTRQKLAMPGIRYEDIDNVNAALEPFLRDNQRETAGDTGQEITTDGGSGTGGDEAGEAADPVENGNFTVPD
ncbi:hypothetical protein MJN85_30370, partial [Salmonella enterica subsp. enterica serovar Anatum]|nr:hypothetical protein [Salmonella enterica subsp. enterica serovar Anatum]